MPLHPALFQQRPILADCPLGQSSAILAAADGTKVGEKNREKHAQAEQLAPSIPAAILNLTQPERVRQWHHDFLQAGARLLSTNTAHAQGCVLAGGTYAGRVESLNTIGIALAQAGAIKAGGLPPGGWESAETTPLDGTPWGLLGCVAQAPTTVLQHSTALVAQSQGEQMALLADAGVDALLLWGFETPSTLQQALASALRISDAPALVVFSTQAAHPQHSAQSLALCQLALDAGAQGVGLEMQVQPVEVASILTQLLHLAEPYQAATALFGSLPSHRPVTARPTHKPPKTAPQHSHLFAQRLAQLAQTGVHVVGLGHNTQPSTMLALATQLGRL